ncbi:hypothetical protein QBC43DRAFT_337980 [Cladorrhinum sp. PSN259]|nr:hypothetical protein QBC43DRAFT_337980 [Cladorrhinum sp. PSN259]
MKTFSILAAIAAFAGLAVAVPAPNPAAAPSSEPVAVGLQAQPTAAIAVVDKRATAHVFVTSDINFAGRQENLQISTGVCLTLGNGWPNTISSFGPDSGLTCNVFDNDGCNNSAGSVTGIRFPGVSDLNTFGFNDRINSFVCF